jgi:hypothetical protein
MAFQLMDFAIYGQKRRPGDETEFRHVRVLQRFRWNGDVCQRIDRSRDRHGPYNAIVLDGDDSPRRVHVLGHEKIRVVD